MEQRLSFITLGVQDLEPMKAFYTVRFGWQPVKEMDGIAFFQMNGFILALFPAKDLAEDIGIAEDGKGFKRFTLAINFESEAAVDAAFETLRSQGVDIVKAPQKVFWGGYSGYIRDPENNYWELAYNPFAEFDKDRNIIGHQ